MESSSLYCYHLSHSASPKLAFLTPTNHPNHKLYYRHTPKLKKIQHRSTSSTLPCFFRLQKHQDASITKSTGHRPRSFQHGNVLAGKRWQPPSLKLNNWQLNDGRLVDDPLKCFLLEVYFRPILSGTWKLWVLEEGSWKIPRKLSPFWPTHPAWSFKVFKEHEIDVYTSFSICSTTRVLFKPNLQHTKITQEVSQTEHRKILTVYIIFHFQHPTGNTVV